jgi:hypothetical protein
MSYIPPEGTTAGSPVNNVIHSFVMTFGTILEKSPEGIIVLVVHSITNKTGKILTPTTD